MVRALVTTLLLAAAGCATAGEPIPAAVTQDRDLKAYEDGGVYRTPIGQREVTGAADLRRFIWTHWTQKRRGYVLVVQQGKDAGATSYVFIEPSSSGWHIAWRSVPYSALPHAPRWSPQDLRDIVAVEQHHDKLTFRDAEGEVVTRL